MLNQQIQNYKILSPLGEGGMAKVYLAEHNLLGSNTAIKLLNKEFTHNDNIRKRFLAEAKSMARMSHPNIIKVSDLIDDGDTVAFVMEYVDGETLKEYIERKVKLSDEEIKSIFSQMLEAVGYVHKQNLVHRDIKPSNFMIDPEGKVKLMDFGIAKNTDANSTEYTQTGTGMQMGTPMYMSPEQITETKSVTSQSDIYSLGVVLWQMVTGEKPYDTKTLSTFQLQTKIVHEDLPKTNTKWDLIIEKSTEKEMKARFENYNSVLNYLFKLKISPEDATIIDDINSLKDSNFLKNRNDSNSKLIECPRCLGKGNVDDEDILRLGKKNIWYPDKCALCKGKGKTTKENAVNVSNENIFISNIDEKNEKKIISKNSSINSKKEMINSIFGKHLKVTMIELIISIPLSYSGIGILFLFLFIFRYIKSKKTIKRFNEKLDSNPNLYNTIEAFSKGYFIVIKLENNVVKIPRTIIWCSKYSKNEILKLLN